MILSLRRKCPSCLASRAGFAVAAASLLLSAARASVPSLVPFQGSLRTPSGDAVPDGPHNVRFSLYNAASGPQQVIGERHIVSHGSVTLFHCPVVVGSDVVQTADGKTLLPRGLAYTIDYATGVLTKTAAAAIPDGAEVQVTYAWTGTSRWEEVQTVQANHGLFAALLGVRTPFAPSLLTGDDWLQVDVDQGGVWESLSPRQRLTAVPYALKAATLDGAMGGTVQGRLTATGPVEGYAGVSPALTAGVKGTGTRLGDQDAPGVLAIGAAGGTGRALEARGSIVATGAITATGPIATDGAITATGDILTYSGIQASGQVEAVSFLSHGLAEIDSLSVTRTIHSGGDIAGRTIRASGDLSSAYATSVGTDLHVSGNAVVTQALTVGGSVSIGGRLSAVGGLRPDFDSGWQGLLSGTVARDVYLPADVNAGDGLVIDVMEGSGTVRFPPQHFTWAYYIGSSDVMVKRNFDYDGDCYYRVRVWKTP